MQIRLLSKLRTELRNKLKAALNGYKPIFYFDIAQKRLIKDELHETALKLLAVLEDPDLIEKTLAERLRPHKILAVRNILGIIEQMAIEKVSRIIENSRKKDPLTIAMQDHSLITGLKRKTYLTQALIKLSLAKGLSLDDIDESEVRLICDELEARKERQAEKSRIFNFSPWKLFGENTRSSLTSSSSNNLVILSDHGSRRKTQAEITLTTDEESLEEVA